MKKVLIILGVCSVIGIILFLLFDVITLISQGDKFFEYEDDLINDNFFEEAENN